MSETKFAGNVAPQQNLIKVHYTQIVRLPDALRKAKPNDPKTISLANNIQAKGLINAFSAAPRVNSETGKSYYVIGDGDRRFTALQLLIHAGLYPEDFYINQLPASTSDDELLAMQMIGNESIEKTTLKQYSRILLRLSVEKKWTPEQLADFLKVSLNFVKNVLKVLHLSERGQNLINEGKITLNKVSAIAEVEAEMSPEEIDEIYELAETASETDIRERVATIKANRVTPKKSSSIEEFVPIAHFIGVKAIKDMYLEIALDSPESKTDFELGYMHCLNRIFEMDRDTISRKKEEFLSQQKERKDKELRRKAETMEKAQKLLKDAGYNIQDPNN